MTGGAGGRAGQQWRMDMAGMNGVAVPKATKNLSIPRTIRSPGRDEERERARGGRGGERERERGGGGGGGGGRERVRERECERERERERGNDEM